MFRHKGKSRTFSHNIKLAAILSFIAGLVNISGVLSVKTLTTNVTGHFAFFAEEFMKKNYANAFIFLLYILFFLLGAFISNLLIEIGLRKRPKSAHAAPMVIEILILIIVGFFGKRAELFNSSGQIIACVLLFAMGIQNSLVTQISDSKVRTTHLTGLFTDLGIELSQLFFYKEPIEKQRLSRSIYLRLIIIAFFFIGCVIGGYLYTSFELKTLLFAAILLTIAFFYDNILYQIYFVKRKLQSR